MMPAVKHLDPVIGVDIHIVMIPTPGGPVPTPLPHPFIGMVYDLMDWIPITIMIPQAMAEGMAAAMGAVESGIQAVGIDMGAQSSSGGGAMGKLTEGVSDAQAAGEGDAEAPPPPSGPADNIVIGPSGPGWVAIPLNASVWVNGVPRGHAGTNGKGPPHFPIGGPVFQRASIAATDSECELLMGSKTVLADGSPFAYLGLPVLSCSCVGSPPPPHPPEEPEAGFFLPTSVVLPIPAGPLVLVGGPPTINWMAWAMKGLGKLAGKAMRVAGRLIGRLLKSVAARLFKNPNTLARINRAICRIFGEPVDAATGLVFSENTDFDLPGPIPLKWERVHYSSSTYEGPLGYGWSLNYDMALGFDEKEKVLALRQPDGRITGSPFLEKGETAFDRQEKLQFFRDERGYGVLDCKERHVFRFSDEKLGEYHPLVRIEDFAGHAINFYHTPDGRLFKIKDSAGRELSVNTDHKGRITSVLAPHPKNLGETFAIVTYEYSTEGDLIASRDAMGYGFRYYYQKHLLTQLTYPSGLNFYWKYDGEGPTARCIHTWGDEGIYDYKASYNTEEQYTVAENSLGHKTTYFWNDQGVVYRELDPLGNAKSTRYNSHAEILSETNELGHTSHYDYDDFGNQTAIFYPDGSSLKMDYKDFLLTSATDQAGGKWQWEYNDAGLLTLRTDPLGSKTKYEYDGGLLKKIIDPAGGVTLLDYDTQFNLTSLTTPDGATSRWEYDALGRCTAAIDPKGNIQKLKFNLNGWVRQVNEPDGNVRELEYDGEGNVVRAKDNQHDVRFEYVGLGRLKARIEAGTRVEFKYDKEENLLGIINEHGYAYRFELDATGEVVTESGFDGITRRYLRDAAGRVMQIKRAGGIVTNYEYDALGRVTAVRHSDGSEEQYAYRPDGELTEASNEHIVVKFERDALGKVIKEIQGNIEVTSVYDVMGMRKELRSSLGARMAMTRNLMGDVESVSAGDEGAPWEASFKRDNLGLELERALPGGVRSEWKRDRLGRPVEHNTFATGGKLSRSRKYVWDVNDRLKQIIDPQKGTWNFEHDALGNLAAAQYPDGAFEFRMPDAVGNLFRSKDQKDRKYGPAGQLLEADGTRYEYDAEGNLIRKTQPGGAVWRYEWNAAGMLARVIRPDGDMVSFSYDALGRRISKTYRNRTTRWVWDGNVPLHEWTEDSGQWAVGSLQSAGSERSGLIKIKKRDTQLATAPANAPPVSSWTEHELLTDDGRRATADRPLPTEVTTWLFEPESFAPLAKLRDGQHYGIVTDHLGTPAAMFDRSGEKVWETDLSIYGEVRTLQGWRESCPFRYPGQYEDVETGLYYNRFRYYDAEGGMYVSQDPIGLVGNFNVYVYVRDTATWCDILGLTGGKGCYRDVGGHHIHAQSAFRGHPNYNRHGALCISQDYMTARGWDHSAMSAKQRELFDDLARSGRPNNMRAQNRIARESLIAGGATRQEAAALVRESGGNLRQQGVTSPTRIPWN